MLYYKTRLITLKQHGPHLTGMFCPMQCNTPQQKQSRLYIHPFFNLRMKNNSPLNFYRYLVKSWLQKNMH
jgi:hypothetical protein